MYFKILFHYFKVTRFLDVGIFLERKFEMRYPKIGV